MEPLLGVIIAPVGEWYLEYEKYELLDNQTVDTEGLSKRIIDEPFMDYSKCKVMIPLEFI